MRISAPAVSHDNLLDVSDSQHHPTNGQWMLPVSVSSPWLIPGWLAHGMTTFTLTANTRYYVPIYVASNTTYDRIGIHVSTAGAAGVVARLGIYNVSLVASFIRPSDLLLDAGTVAVDTTGQKEITISETLTTGWYFLVYQSDGAPTLASLDTSLMGRTPVSGISSSINSTQSYLGSRTIADGAAALPDPSDFPFDLVSAAAAAIFLRV